MKLRGVALVALLAAFPLLLNAQTVIPKVNAEISFDFQISGKVLPAGSYSFAANKDGVVTVTNLKSLQSFIATVLTRLADIPGSEAAVVFDKVGNTYYLSELHIPGIDGYHFTGAPGPHSHVRASGKK